MPEARKYRTIDAPTSAELRDRGSKFLAFAFPVKTLDEIKTHHKALKSAHPKANHHCIAYRLGHDGTQYRAGDDGEPAGSAGRPMLGAIDSAGLTNVLVVVVRYFGGTLLGVPGLIAAYGGAATAALSGAAISEHWVTVPVHVECDYSNLGEVLHTLKKHEAIIDRQDLQLFCSIEASLPEHNKDICLKQLSEIRGVKAGVAKS